MRKNNLDSIISKVITETLEDKANGIATKLNELGGMDDGHPKFGKLNLSKMSDDDIEDLMSSDMSYEYDDEDYNDEQGDDDGYAPPVSVPPIGGGSTKISIPFFSGTPSIPL